MNPQKFSLGSMVAIATAVGALSLIVRPVSAFTLTPLNENFAFRDPNVPEDWENLNWIARGRASAPGDWEFGITQENNNLEDHNNQNWDWKNGEDVPWTLNWDGNTVTFNIGGNDLSYEQSNPPASEFDGFFLWTKSQTGTNKVTAGTEAFLQVNSVNGQSVDPVSSTAVAPESGAEIGKYFFASDTEIESLEGILRINWPDGGLNPQDSRARDRVAFKIEGFDVPDTFFEVDSVPEPASILGLLAFGALSAVSGIARKK